MAFLGAVILLFLFAAALVAAFIYLSPEKVVWLALNSERRRAGLTRKEMNLQDGLYFSYLEGGQGEPLMLLHGFGGNKDNFVRVARYLSRHYRLIIPDVIGFAESSRPVEIDYSSSTQVQRLRELLQALDIRQVHLGGNSMGAQLAMTYAAMHPREVRSLWLISPSGVWSAPESPVLGNLKETGNNPLIAKNVHEYKQIMALGMSKPPFVPKRMLAVIAKERIRNVRQEEKIFEVLRSHSVEEQIEGNTTPTLIVFGEQDKVIPIETADILHDLMPNSQVVLMPGVGHVAMFENAKQCAEDYLQFRQNSSS